MRTVPNDESSQRLFQIRRTKSLLHYCLITRVTDLVTRFIMKSSSELQKGRMPLNEIAHFLENIIDKNVINKNIQSQTQV